MDSPGHPNDDRIKNNLSSHPTKPLNNHVAMASETIPITVVTAAGYGFPN